VRLAFVLALLLPGLALAQEARRPLLEAGVFGGAALLPDYPAAEESRARALALPWLIYRGEILRSDERGLQGRLLRSGDLEFTLNANGALGSESDGGGARAGMPGLDHMGEIGPSLRWIAWRQPDRRGRVTLELPLRAVFTTDFSSIETRGAVFAPELAYERLDALRPGARARIGIGPVFASGGVMDYWYGVEPRYARAGRPAYDATGGYLGMRLQFSWRLPVTERVSLTAGGRVESFAGAANADSPLFRSELNASLVGGVSVSLYRSGAMVASGAEPFD
jgi:hypothetical protein